MKKMFLRFGFVNSMIYQLVPVEVPYCYWNGLS